MVEHPFSAADIPKMAWGISHCCFKTTRSILSSPYRYTPTLLRINKRSRVASEEHGAVCFKVQPDENFHRPFYDVTILIKNDNSGLFWFAIPFSERRIATALKVLATSLWK